MKKFKFTIRGNNYDVEVGKIEENIAEIDVNGTSYEVEIHKEIAATLCLRAEREELGIQCGLQDRVIQTYQGLVFMDFDKIDNTVFFRGNRLSFLFNPIFEIM